MELPQSVTPLKMFVIDDDDLIHPLLDALFSRHSVNIMHASDGTAALKRLRQEKFDLVLMDLMLPGTNGFEIIRELKQFDPEVLSRTVVITAAADWTLRDFEDGRLVRKLVRKPFDVSELMEEVLSSAPAPSKSLRPRPVLGELRQS